jgi:hypothetical protein
VQRQLTRPRGGRRRQRQRFAGRGGRERELLGRRGGGGQRFGYLSATLYNLSNYFNLDTVTQAISNLYGDVDSMVAYFNGASVPASPGVADPDDMTSFDSDSKVVAKDCGISLPLPKSAQTNG